MRPLFFYLAFIFLSIGACSQPPRLIVRGDDMGFSHAGNLGLIKAQQEGIQTCIEVMVPSPWFPEAVKMLSEANAIDIGIHITLTSEWDNIKYRPVSYCPSLTDEDGYFYPMIWPNKNYPGKSLLENKWTMEDIEKELRAQIELGLQKIQGITHISAHMGCYEMNPEVKLLAKRLAKEYAIDIDPVDYGVESVQYIGAHKTPSEKIKSFIAMLETLKHGKTYLFVEHPGLDTPELRAIHHIGYEDVAEDRQGVTLMFTDTRVKETIKNLNIQLISYKDLKK